VPDAGSLLGCYDWVELGHMSCTRKDAIAKRGERGTNAWQLVGADDHSNDCPESAAVRRPGDRRSDTKALIKEARSTIEALL
jgi:hypothetical protein